MSFSYSERLLLFCISLLMRTFDNVSSSNILPRDDFILLFIDSVVFVCHSVSSLIFFFAVASSIKPKFFLILMSSVCSFISNSFRAFLFLYSLVVSCSIFFLSIAYLFFILSSSFLNFWLFNGVSPMLVLSKFSAFSSSLMSLLYMSTTPVMESDSMLNIDCLITIPLP